MYRLVNNLIKNKRFLVMAVILHMASVSTLVYAQQSPGSAQQAISVPAESEFPVPTVSGVPTELFIASLGIRLNIDPGTYDKATDSWTLSGYNAHFATITRPANNGGGNTFIYGHNNKDVFGPMKLIQPNAELEVLTDNGSKFYYSLESTKTVEPSDVSLFSYTGAPILTIQTCTGFWHEQRGLYQFRLQRIVESSASVAIRTEASRKALLATVGLPLQLDLRLVADPSVAAEPTSEQPVKEFVAQEPQQSSLEGIKALTQAAGSHFQQISLSKVGLL